MRKAKKRDFLYTLIHNWPWGSVYKYYTLLEQAYGGRSVAPVDAKGLRELLVAYQPEIVFLHGDWRDHFIAPLELGIPYVLIEHDVYTLRLGLKPARDLSESERIKCDREGDMIRNAAAVILTSEYLIPYLQKRYGLPHYAVIHLRPLKTNVQFALPTEKPPGKHLVYAGGDVGWEGRTGLYGYRAYHKIFAAFIEAGWTVHLYPASWAPANTVGYEEMGVKVHGRLPYPDLLKEMSVYTAGLQGFNLEGVPPAAAAYTQHYCVPNKCFDYLAAGIPTIGVNPGRCAEIYTKGKWGVVLKELSADAIHELEGRLPIVTEAMRQAQVMDHDLPKLKSLVRYALERTRRRKRAVVTVLDNVNQTKGDGSMGNMILRVKSGFAIPRVVKIAFDKSVRFNPDGEVPEDVGKRFLKNLPTLFELPVGKPDLKKYTRLDVGTATAETAAPGLDLTEEETALVLAHRKKQEEAKKAAETPAPSTPVPPPRVARPQAKATAKK